MPQDFENASAFLKQASANGETLYDHLTQVLLKIAKDKPENALAELEILSVAVKKAKLQPQSFKEISEKALKPSEERKMLEAIEKCLQVVQSVPEVSIVDLSDAESAKAQIKAMKEAEAEEEDIKKAEVELTPAFLKQPLIPDMLAEAQLLANAGVGISKEEAYTLLLSIQNLSRQQGNFVGARFFGKILGTQKDYYIVEASLTSYPKEEVDPRTKKEPAGTGANFYVYFASNSSTGPWTQLPDVLPEQIITARSMRRYLSGNLAAPVLGFPRFPWPEGSYLRAQLSRIAAATVVSPKGIFEMQEAPEEAGEDAPEVMVRAEEPEIPGADELKEAENWCHHVAQLLKQGRCTAWAPPEGEEEEEDAAEDEEPEEPEEPLPMLSGLEGDVLPALPVGEDEEEEEEEENKPGVWRLSMFPANTLHRVNAAFCLSWPGAVAVAQGKYFANVYVGYGQKQLQSLYAPPPPPTVAKEFVSPFNPEEAEEGEVDPLIEQLEPQPPKEDKDGDEGDEGDDEDE